MELCRLCPHACGADRGNGKTGFCGAGASPRVFRWGPHFGEEPPLVGEHGSGCMFFLMLEILPFRTFTTRSAIRAISGLWVTIMTVDP